MNFISRFYSNIAIIATGLSCLLVGCTDDFDTTGAYKEIEGEDTRISISISAPDMAKRESRADLSEADANNVQTLWIGIYSQKGESTLNTGSAAGLYLDKDDKAHGFTPGQKQHTKYTLTDLDTKSGRSFIVAVANPDVNKGHKMTADGKLGDEKTLLELLQGATTWNDFLSIVVTRGTLEGGFANLYTPNATVNPLPMSGVYADETMNSHPADTNFDWTEIKPVYIPINKGGATLPGLIHLRRIYSQVKFNISAATTTNNVQIVDIEPISYTVHNVPTYSWLYEHKHIDGATGVYNYANAGDPMDTNVKTNANYPSSLIYTSTDIEQSNGTLKFDFWQMENKRIGILTETENDYQKREAEYNDDAGAPTGVYKSLCPEPGTETLNNLATYIEFRCNLTYKEKVNPTNPVIPDLPDDFVSRTVDARYVIHLGYVDRDANDFSLLRNSIYTYNVKILSASDIIVEAYRQGENQPGAEGIVTDVTGKMYNLDSHYAAFNIELDDTELDAFSFSMMAPYDGTDYIFEIKDDEAGSLTERSMPIPTSTTDPSYNKYSWVELVQTTDNLTLAPYPGINNNTNKFKLNEVRSAYKDGKIHAGWFTVFVNEYTYEDDTDDTNRGDETANNWKKYAGAGVQPRSAYLNVAQSISSDGNSSYFRSKYAITQRPIQTYYDNNATTGDAIGVEHTNETFGMNIRWLTGNSTPVGGSAQYPGVSTTGLNENNGRYNVWAACGGTSGGTTARNWTVYVQMGNGSLASTATYYYGKVNKVNQITNTNQNLPESMTKAAVTYPVPMPVLLASSNFTTDQTVNLNSTNPFPNAYNSRAGAYDPQTDYQTAQYIQAMHACMNRNRDINGDGVIDANELRWYLPASGKYVRVIMGRNSLENPIMDYDNNPTLPFGSGKGQNTRFHLISSDNVIIWAEEGLSRSMFTTQQYSGPPWAVRCIRNLGTNLNTINNSDDDGVDPAYVGTTGTGTRSTGGVVKVNHYYGNSLRDYSGRALPMHKSNSPYNKLGRYGFEIALRGNQTTTQQNGEASATAYRSSTTVYTNAVDNQTPCATLNSNSGRTGWRVPNQKEIVIMRRLGVLSGNFFMTCTQEYWNTNGQSNTDDFNRILTVRSDAACAEVYSALNYVRCVRDLTADEANKSYDDIVNNR